MYLIIILSLLLLAIVAFLVIYCVTHKKKESYYRAVQDWGNTPPLVYKNGWYSIAKAGCDSAAADDLGEMADCGCADRHSSDMSDPYRFRYPITPPSPFEPYELPHQVCPKCTEAIKTKLQ